MSDHEQAPVTLRDLAQRLTPNPALTVDGTLQIILSGIEKLDDELLARTFCWLANRLADRDSGPITDEQWAAEDLNLKVQLMQNVQVLKAAFREMSR